MAKKYKKRGTPGLEHGYIYILQEREHRLVVEKALGRKLVPPEVVHHVDGNKLNNLPSNLIVCPDHSYHMLLHRRQAALDAGAPAHWLKCAFCKEYDAPENLYVKQVKSTMQYSIHHRSCASAWHKQWRASK